MHSCIWILLCIPVYTALVFKGLWLSAGNPNVPLWSSLLIDSPTAAAAAAADSVEGKGNRWQGPISVLREKCGGWPLLNKNQTWEEQSKDTSALLERSSNLSRETLSVNIF